MQVSQKYLPKQLDLISNSLDFFLQNKQLILIFDKFNNNLIQLKIEMDFRKTYCIYHPSELITNFCTQKKCSVPLCPTCVCKHLEYHIKNGSNPTLSNITQTILKVTNSIGGNINVLQKTKVKIEILNQQNNQIIYKISELIFQTKVRLKQLIEKKLSQIEKQILYLIQNKNKEIGLHCSEKSKILEEKISKQLNYLHEMNKDINSDKLLQVIITYLQKKQFLTQCLIKQSVYFIQTNQKYKVDVQINKNIFSEIQNIFNKLTNIKFNIPLSLQKTLSHTSSQNKIIQQPKNKLQNQNQFQSPFPMPFQRQHYKTQPQGFYQRSLLKTFQTNMNRPQTPTQVSSIRQNEFKFPTPINMNEKINLITKISSKQLKQNLQKGERKGGISLQRKLDQSGYSTCISNLKQQNRSNQNQL